MTYNPAGVSAAHGEIYIDTGAATQTTNGTADTFDLMTGWNTAQGVDGASSGTTPAKASNKITLDSAGTYKVIFTCSFLGGQQRNLHLSRLPRRCGTAPGRLPA